MKNNNLKKPYVSETGMLSGFLQGAKAFFAAGMVCACLASLADMLRPKIVQYVIDGVLDDNLTDIPVWVLAFADRMGGIRSLQARLWIPAMIVMLCSVAGVVFRYIYQITTAKGSERFVKTMRDELFEHVEHLSLSWHSAHQTGDIIQRCTSDIEEVKTFLSEHLINLLSMLITIFLALWFMFRINLLQGVLALLFVPVMVCTSYFFHQKIHDGFLRCDENEGALSTIAQENLTGVRVVRAFGREQSERDRFEKQSSLVTDKWVDLGRFMCVYFSSVDFLTEALVVIELTLAVVNCVKGHMTVGELMAMMTYLTMLIRPVRTLGRILSEMSKTTVSIHRLYEIMQTPVEADLPEAVTPPLNGDIRFEHVHFAYPGNPELLHDVDFTVNGGTTLGILGSTGSGKSTIAQLLCRLYPVEEGCGRITIGGVDIRQMDGHYLRTHVAYVLQEPFLFSRSLGENIGIAMDMGADVAGKMNKASDVAEKMDTVSDVSGKMNTASDASGKMNMASDVSEKTDLASDASEKIIRESSHAACLDSVIEKFPQGFDTFVGERGVTLSGGQKQRAAIARALTLQAPILIFDDSLSAVDTETDAAIRANLKTYMKDATVILISHRISTLMDADQILVLENGRITDVGTHQELKNRPGLYKTICEIQEGGEEDER